MALNRKKLPIKIGGLDTKTDDDQALPGTFRIMDNVVYNKIGRIEKRQGFTTDKREFSSLQNLNRSGAPRQTTQYTSISSTLINDKITKYTNTNELLFLTRSNIGKSDLHSYSRGFISPAEQLTCDLDIKNVSGNNFFNADLSSTTANYNEQYQNSAYEPNLNLVAAVATDSNTNSPVLKIYNDDKEIFSYIRQNSGTSNSNLYSKLMFFKTSSTTAVLTHIYVLTGTLTIVSCDFYQIQYQSARKAFEVSGPNNTLIYNYGGSLNNDLIALDVEKLDDTHFCLAFNNSTYNIDWKVFEVSYSSGLSSTSSSVNSLIAGVLYNNISIRKLPDGVGPSSTKHYVAIAYNEYAGGLNTTAIKSAIIEMPKTYASASSFYKAVATLHDFSTRGIVNIGIGQFGAAEVSGNEMSVYVTTSEQTVAGNSDYHLNQIDRIGYDVTLNSKITVKTIFKGMTLASKPVLQNYNDYFLMAFCDIFQPSLYLACADKRGEIYDNDSVVSRFFWGNTGVFFPNYNTRHPSNKIIYQSWLTNLNLKTLTTDAPSFKDEFTNDKTYYQPKLIAAIPYREKFISLNNQLDSTIYNVTNTSFNTFDPKSLTYYKDSNSTKIAEFNLNSKNRFTNVEINQTKYFTGGHLSLYDGNKLDNPNFFQYPILKNNPTDFSVFDTSISKLIGSVDTGNDRLVLSGNPGIFGKGDKVKVVSTTTLPAGITLDSLAQLTAPYAQLSDEYTIESTGLVGSDLYVRLENGGALVDITSSGSGTLYLVKTPYQTFEPRNYVGFCAVYEYKDNNGKIYRSAPSEVLYKYFPSDLTYKTIIKVLNYNFPNKINYELGLKSINPVYIKVYRTQAGGGNFYECATGKCTLTGDYIDIDVQGAADSKLIANPILYTTGSVLENIAPPASSSLTIKNDRVYSVNGENRNEIWYSKKIINGEGIEFNDTLTISVDDSDGKIVAIQAMDDKIIIFKNSKIYFIAGDGANEVGLGASFSQVEKLSNDLGLDINNPKALCLTDLGIFFKSQKGLYLLDRASLKPVFIGAGLEDYLNNESIIGGSSFPVFEIYNIMDIKDNNEVRLITNNGVFSYNTLQNFWTRSVSITGYAAGVNKFYDGLSDDNNFYLLYYHFEMARNSDGKIYYLNVVLKETEDFYGDIFDPFLGSGFTNINNAPFGDITVNYNVSLRTNWINPSGLQNFNRLYNLFFLGMGKIDASTTSLYYDYDNALNSEDVYSYNFTTGTATKPYQFKTHIRNMKSESFSISLVVANDYTSGLWTLTNILAEFGVKRKTPLGLNKKT